MNLARRLVVGALLCCACAPALAHRFHAGLVEIAFNQRTGSIEVVHTYMAHDIEPLIATLAGQPLELDSAEAGQLLRTYLDQRFYLLGADQARLPLRWVGMTAGVDSVVVYQELAATALAQVAQVHQAVLTDLLPRQSNTVNVHIDGAIRSLAFDATTVDRRLR